MKISFWVYIIPNSNANKIEGIKKYENHIAFKIQIAKLNENNEANNELIKYLAKYFQIPKNDIKISLGSTQRLKLIKMNYSLELAQKIENLKNSFNFEKPSGNL